MGQTKCVAILSCMVFMSAQMVLAKPSSVSEHDSPKIMAQTRVEKTVPGTYHYESHYEMSKDEKGNYRSTYQSKKQEWFCCLDWFSSEEAPSTKADES